MRRARPKFDGEKLVAVADASWDMLVLWHEFVLGTADEEQLLESSKRLAALYEAALVKPLLRGRAMKARMQEFVDDFGRAHRDPDRNDELVAALNRLTGIAWTIGLSGLNDLSSKKTPEA